MAYGKKSFQKKNYGGKSYEKKSYGNKSYTKRNDDEGEAENNGGGFIGIGSITASKKSAEDAEGLKDSGLQLWWKVFLPKGSNQITLKRGDRVMISFKTFDGEPDFVLGHVVLPPESEE